MNTKNFHVFTHNTDEYTKDEKEAYTIYNTYVADYDCARLYEETRDDEGELLEENCLEAHGPWPN